MSLYSMSPPELGEILPLARTYAHTLRHSHAQCGSHWTENSVPLIRSFRKGKVEGVLFNEQTVMIWSQEFRDFVKFNKEDRDIYLQGGSWIYLVLDIEGISAKLEAVAFEQIELQDSWVIGVSPNWYRALYLAIRHEGQRKQVLAG